jgi:hypothetical protein
MKFTDAKNDTDVALKGIKTEIEWHDKSAKAVTLTDVDGRVVRIAKGEYSQLDILIPAPPTFVDTWRVAGRIPGIQDAVLEYFEFESDARDRVRKLDEALRVEHELKVEKVRITEEEAAAHTPPASRIGEEVPF